MVSKVRAQKPQKLYKRSCGSRTERRIAQSIITLQPSHLCLSSSIFKLLQPSTPTPDVQSRLPLPPTTTNLKVRIRGECRTDFRVFNTPPLFQPEHYQYCQLASADRPSFQNGHMQLLLKAHHWARGDEEGVGELRVLHRRVQQVHPLHLAGQRALEVLQRLLHQRPGQVHPKRLHQRAEAGQPGLRQAAQPARLGGSRTEISMVDWLVKKKRGGSGLGLGTAGHVLTLLAEPCRAGLGGWSRHFRGGTDVFGSIQ